MISEPKKPKNYYRDYAVIFVLGLLIGAGLIYFKVQYVTVIIPVAFITIVPSLWFREYYTAQREYLSQNSEPKHHKQTHRQSDVNKNIVKYLADERLKRANKTWWQFWL